MSSWLRLFAACLKMSPFWVGLCLRDSTLQLWSILHVRRVYSLTEPLADVSSVFGAWLHSFWETSQPFFRRNLWPVCSTESLVLLLNQILVTVPACCVALKLSLCKGVGRMESSELQHRMLTNFSCHSDQDQIIRSMFVAGIFFSSVEANVELNLFKEHQYTASVFTTWAG